MFSYLSRILATLALLLGAAQLALGVAIAWGAMGPREAALARYTGASSTGEVINEAVMILVGALVVGTLAEIAFALKRATN